METRLGCPHLAQGRRVSAGHTGVQVASELVSFEMELQLEMAMIGLSDVQTVESSHMHCTCTCTVRSIRKDYRSVLTI